MTTQALTWDVRRAEDGTTVHMPRYVAVEPPRCLICGHGPDMEHITHEYLPSWARGAVAR